MALINTPKQSIHINWFVLIMTLIFAAFAVATVYFFFFQTPPLVETLVPIDKRTERIEQIVIAPNKIRDNPKFQQLRSVPIFLEPIQVGRNNPFLDPKLEASLVESPPVETPAETVPIQ